MKLASLLSDENDQMVFDSFEIKEIVIKKAISPSKCCKNRIHTRERGYNNRLEETGSPIPGKEGED